MIENSKGKIRQFLPRHCLFPLVLLGDFLRKKAFSRNPEMAVDTLSKTIQATQRKWQDRIDKVLKPIEADIDKAIASTAKALGCNMVLDRLVARNSALVV